MPDDLDELLATLEAKGAEVDAAIAAVEAEQAAGRIGHAAYMKAKAAAGAYEALAATAQAKISEALSAL